MEVKFLSGFSGRRAYTLVEVLCAVVILSFSTLYIFSAFFKSQNTLLFLSSRYEANSITDNLIALNEEKFRKEKELSKLFLDQSPMMSADKFTFNPDITPLDSRGKFCEFRATLKWVSDKEYHVSKTSYFSR